MRRLGITGGIGSGKSFVCSILEETFGLPVYYCDAEAKRLIDADPDIKESLKNLVGKEVYDESGALNKPVLASYLFDSDEHVALANAIVHPAVRKDFRLWCAGQTATLVCMESAILYESGFDTEVDEVLLIDAPLETRIARAMQRDSTTRDEVMARMQRQNASLASGKANHTIYNNVDTTKESIINQIKEKILC